MIHNIDPAAGLGRIDTVSAFGGLTTPVAEGTLDLIAKGEDAAAEGNETVAGQVYQQLFDIAHKANAAGDFYRSAAIFEAMTDIAIYNLEVAASAYNAGRSYHKLAVELAKNKNLKDAIAMATKGIAWYATALKEATALNVPTAKQILTKATADKATLETNVKLYKNPPQPKVDDKPATDPKPGGDPIGVVIPPSVAKGGKVAAGSAGFPVPALIIGGGLALWLLSRKKR